MPDDVSARAATYVATPAGREHALAILHRRMASQGVPDEVWTATGEQVWLGRAVDLFAGTHGSVVVARRHFVDGATPDDQLAGSGTLTPDEHHRYLELSVETMRELYAAQPYAPGTSRRSRTGSVRRARPSTTCTSST